MRKLTHNLPCNRQTAHSGIKNSGLPNLLPALTAMLIMIILWGYQICVYRRASAALASRRLLLSAPLFWLMRPLINGIYRMRFKANKSSNYTWSK